jgi:hypothetical protein
MPGKRSGRFTQMKQAFDLTRRNDRKMIPLVAATGLGTLAVLVLIGFLVGQPFIGIVLGVAIGLAGAMVVFGRRAQAAAFGQVEGQLGAAAAVLQSMRGDWRVTPVVAVTRNQDVVHRVVGRPGVILVGEGSPTRVAQLLAVEKKKVGRVATETPVYDVIVGDEDGQVPLRKLQSHFMRLPRNLKPAQVRAVESRMRALGTAIPPIPKGPIPRTGRIPRGKVR